MGVRRGRAQSEAARVRGLRLIDRRRGVVGAGYALPCPGHGGGSVSVSGYTRWSSPLTWYVPCDRRASRLCLLSLSYSSGVAFACLFFQGSWPSGYPCVRRCLYSYHNLELPVSPFAFRSHASFPSPLVLNVYFVTGRRDRRSPTHAPSDTLSVSPICNAHGRASFLALSLPRSRVCPMYICTCIAMCRPLQLYVPVSLYNLD